MIGEVRHSEVGLTRKKKLAIVYSIDVHEIMLSDTPNYLKILACRPLIYAVRAIQSMVCVSPIDYVQAKFCYKTLMEKRLAYRLLLKSIKPTTLTQQVTRVMVLAHLQKQAASRSGYAANKDRKNLVAAWHWGKKYIEGFPADNPCMVERFPEQRKRRYVPPEADFWTVYDTASPGQDKTMLLAYLHLAARRNELFQLRWEDVDLGVASRLIIFRKRVILYSEQGGCLRVF